MCKRFLPRRIDGNDRYEVSHLNPYLLTILGQDFDKNPYLLTILGQHFNQNYYLLIILGVLFY